MPEPRTVLMTRVLGMALENPTTVAMVDQIEGRERDLHDYILFVAARNLGRQEGMQTAKRARRKRERKARAKRR